MELKLNKKILGAIFLLIVLVVVAYGVKLNQSNKKSGRSDVLFSIDDKKYTRKDVDKYLNFYREVQKYDEKQSLDTVIEDTKVIVAAQNIGLSPTDQDLKRAKETLITQGWAEDFFNKYPDYFALAAKKTAIENMANQSLPSGYSYDFYFGQHIQYGPRYKPVGLGDRSLIDADRKYAKEQADYFNEALSKGNITSDEALNQIKADEKLGGSAYNHSSKFDPQSIISLYYDDIRSYVQNPLKPGVSEVRVGTASPSPGAEPVDIFYYFIYNQTDASNSGVYAKINEAKAKLKVQVYSK